MSRLLLLLLSLVSAPPLRAQADADVRKVLGLPPRVRPTSFWAQERLSFGKRAFLGHHWTGGVQTPEGWTAQAEHRLYRGLGLTGSVQGTGLMLGRARPGTSTSLRLFHSFRKDGAALSGAGLHGAASLRDQDTSTTLSGGVAFARHRLPLAYGSLALQRSSLSQWTFEASLQQAYFDLFQFDLGGALFLYDRDMDALGALRTRSDLGPTAWFLAMRPVTDPPRWTANLMMARRLQAGLEATAFAGYGRVNFAGPLGVADALSAGLTLQPRDGWTVELSGGLWAPSRGADETMGGAMVRWRR